MTTSWSLRFSLRVRRRSCVRAAHVVGATVFAALSVFTSPPALATVVDFAAHPAGHILQSADFPPGITLSVVNNKSGHPNLAIVFDSACTVATCSGEDEDLRTPGAGPGNTIPQGKIMIVAEDAVDTTPADGLVDDPDDEKNGGKIQLQFAVPHKLKSIRGIDFEANETPTRIEMDKVGGGTLTAAFSMLGDNSAETLTIANPPASNVIRFIFVGSGGLDELVLVQACGDGVLDSGEQCDPPGSPVGSATCSASCTLVAPSCGNSVVEAGENCDPPASQGGAPSCNDDCTSSVCGDSAVEAGEQCDPPAAQGGAANCNPSCKLSVCGNGTLEAGEQCDPPGPQGSATCLPNCTLLVGSCGNATLDSGEECDPPASQGGLAICNDDCTLSVCGDTELDAGEQCDPPAGSGGAANCNADCTLSACGDSVVGAGEDCDPPNGTTCDASCQTIGACGNNTVEPPELCDPPNPGEICNNLVDDDGDLLVDCDDTNCAIEEVALTTCGAFCELVECQPLISDPGEIIVNEPGVIGFLSVHGRVRLAPDGLDPRTSGVAVDLRNADGLIYRGALVAGDLKAVGAHRYRFIDRSAREGEGIRDGLFRVGTRFRKIGGAWFYTFQVRAYGDFSRATLARMITQIYAGSTVGYLSADWRPSRKGWRLELRDFNAQ